jgi:uncharacterized lipoprotein YajG
MSLIHRGVSVALVLALVTLTAGCADRIVTLRYKPPAEAPQLGPRVVVGPFTDMRGSEGDRDPYRVGGVYGGYGNRLAKIIATRPWSPDLVLALVAELRGQGFDASAAGASADAPPARSVLTGEIRNFSTESRWGMEAHISGNIRVVDEAGRVLVEKRISERAGAGMGAGVLIPSDPLESNLNEALSGFVRKIATDPEISAQLRR